MSPVFFRKGNKLNFNSPNDKTIGINNTVNELNIFLYKSKIKIKEQLIKITLSCRSGSLSNLKFAKMEPTIKKYPKSHVKAQNNCRLCFPSSSLQHAEMDFLQRANVRHPFKLKKNGLVPLQNPE